MTTILGCLASFAVAAQINSPDAAEKAKKAIDAYLLCSPPEPLRQRAALHELHAAFLALELDSEAATEIREEIERRIVRTALLPLNVAEPDQHA